MAERLIRIAMNGVTGRLGQNQHLVNSILAIRREGGLPLANGDRLMPEPILVGRNADKLARLAAAHGVADWSTDMAAVLADPEVEIYFDVAATAGRRERALAAIAAGKHIYLEKPIADTLEDALAIARAAAGAGLCNAVVQDKVFLPGFQKLRKLKRAGFFGRVLSVKLDFGWWIFDGEMHPAQRSSWNYRKAEGGGLILDMFPHWRYMIDGLVAPVTAVSCRHATVTPTRRDEAGQPYAVDVEDEVAATFELEGGAFAQVTSSWATRVRKDDMLTLQVDGEKGSALATLHRCFIQPDVATPKPAWNVQTRVDHDFQADWQEVPDVDPFKNSYRCGWELFLKHVVEGAPFPSPLIEGAKGLQLVDACYRSNRERRWVDLPALAL
ncbi:Gfo/Idh/MocA family protein [Aquabacter spiritensis]|uniref:Putative dehydrogenase n=1 Tax=Aquabacter spiritensis TaxID=933073 RepID=A0A4R3LR62_9HYPH|nr:Gfo/Idh/MocA family oxidoreductase [Aquabacter spiritensis]TCT00597.1 putative dehydrogenase [Aquabacter spiritensis]